MTNSTEPTAFLSHLHRADGSATFSHNNYVVIGSVNGPIEVQRRDELPEEAAIDVIVRPAAGVGGIRERYLESILQSTLRQILLIHNFPRSLIQVTLQITSTPETSSAKSKSAQTVSSLALLPTLLQTAVLALLSASIPLSMTVSSVLLALVSNGDSHTIMQSPDLRQIEEADSVHVLGFSSKGELLLTESEGNFTVDDWDKIHDFGMNICCTSAAADGDFGMADDSLNDKSGGMQDFVKGALQAKVQSDLHWK